MKTYVLAFSLLFSSYGLADGGCDNEMTTIGMNVCMSHKLEKEDTRLKKYTKRSVKRYSEDKIIVKSIELSHTAWEDYRKVYCDAIYDLYRDGSIRGYMALTCKIKLTKQRTYLVWEDYLGFSDSTPALLPKPDR